MTERFMPTLVPTVTPPFYDLKEMQAGDTPSFLKVGTTSTFPTKDDDIDRFYATDVDEIFRWSTVNGRWESEQFRDFQFVVPYDDFSRASGIIDFAGTPPYADGVIIVVGNRQYEFKQGGGFVQDTTNGRWRVLTDTADPGTHCSRFVDAFIGNTNTVGSTWFAPGPILSGGGQEGTYRLPHATASIEHLPTNLTQHRRATIRPYATGAVGNTFVVTKAGTADTNITVPADGLCTGGGGQGLPGGNAAVDANGLWSVPWAGPEIFSTTDFGYLLPTGNWAIRRWFYDSRALGGSAFTFQLCSLTAGTQLAVMSIGSGRSAKIGGEPASFTPFAITSFTDGGSSVAGEVIGLRNPDGAGVIVPPGSQFWVRLHRVSP